jgi:signal transduction histidine kinase/CheY-like chemotaxis protein
MRMSAPGSEKGRIGRVVSGFLKGGLREPENDEARQRLAMINVISAIGVANCIVLGIAAYFRGNLPLAIIDHSVAVLLTANLVYLRLSCRYYVAAGMGLSLVAVFFLYLLLTGGVEGTGHVWFYTFPLISTFLLGSWGGAWTSVAILLGATVVFLFGSGRLDWVYVYDGAFVARFVPSYLVVLAYAYYFERFREQIRWELTIRNVELREARAGLERRVEERTAELRQSKELFTTVLNSIDANVYAADMESHEILFMNRRMQEAFGADLVGTKCFQSLRGQSEPCAECTNPRLVDDRRVPTDVVTWEGRNEKVDNWYLHRDRAVEWVDGRIVRLQVATDLTERKHAEEERQRLQEQLVQAQKMEAIGSLAGGVAHDLNNILSAILGYPDLILMDLPPDSHLREPLLTMKESGAKCARIVSDLLTLARSGAAKQEPVNLTRVVNGLLTSPEFLSLKTHYPGVEVVTILEGDLPSVAGTEVNVFKAALNLVTNAFEAMPTGGRLQVRTRYQVVKRPIRGFATIPPGAWVVLSVTDTGIGIPPEDLPRIFEPFYTRKATGRSGTGLGMAVVWGAVMDHDGRIDVKTAPGAGTEFEIYLPVPDDLPDTVDVEIECPEGAGERILVVDDLEEQRELAGEILERLGYQVETAASGEEAVERLRGEEPDLLLLDMIMSPGIDGLETYRRALEVRPGIRAIIVSGYSENERVEAAQELGAGPYLRKPYLVHELALAVRRELNR